jgi:hypothetical protein
MTDPNIRRESTTYVKVRCARCYAYGRVDDNGIVLPPDRNCPVCHGEGFTMVEVVERVDRANADTLFSQLAETADG